MASIDRIPSGKYRAQIRRKGVATERQLFDTKSEAESWARTREAELITLHNTAVAKTDESQTLAETTTGYFTSPKFSDKAESTQRREKIAAKQVLPELGAYAITVLTVKQVQAYFDKRAGQKSKTGKVTSGDTMRIEKALLSAVFAYAKRRSLIDRNIMLEKYELRKCKRRELRVSPLNQGFLLDIGKEQSERYNGNQALLPWLVVVMETGMRPGEAAKVELDWFKPEKLQLEIPEDGQKKRAARIVMLTEDTVELLKQQADRAIAAESKYLFFSISTISKKPVAFSYTTPYARLSKKVGIKGGAHALRHEFISRLFEESNMSDSQIALLAGDKSTMSLEPYKHLSVNKLREQHNEVAANVKIEQNKEVAHYLKTEFTKRVEAGIAKLLADRDKKG